MTPENYITLLPSIIVPNRWESWMRKPIDKIWDDIAAIEDMLVDLEIRIKHKKRGCPSYHQEADIISMVQKDRYRYSWAYYGALLHEVGHWTGHPDRLDREQVCPEDNPETYAKEELVAEIFSRAMCLEYGMQEGEKQHLEYLKMYWDKVECSAAALMTSYEKSQEALQFVNSALQLGREG